MSSNNTRYYQKAINVLMNENVDYKKIVIALAQINPKLFIRLIDDPNVFKPVEQWHRDVKQFIIADKKVEAIKRIREKTGFGLKESKDISDHLQNYFAERGLCRPYEYSFGVQTELSAEQKEIYFLVTRA